MNTSTERAAPGGQKRLWSRLFWVGLVWLSFAGGLRAQTQWTVDDSGGADFTSLQVAIDTVSAGDVLRIKPGVYGDVVLNKRLRLLGAPTEPSGVLPVLQSLDIQGSSAFTLAHLEIRRLRAVDVTGRSEIDRCVLGGSFNWGSAGGSPSGFSPVLLHGVQDLLVSRVQVVRPTAATQSGRSGMIIESTSTVQLVQSSVQGGDGLQDTIQWLSGFGGTGLEVKQSSRVWLIESSITGGDGENLFIPLGPSDPGGPGTGMKLSGGSVVDARGTPANQIRGGHPQVGSPWLGPATNCVASTLLLHVGGVALNGQVPAISAGPCQVVSGIVPPRLTLQGQSAPGATVVAHIFGSAAPGGLPVALYANLTPALLELPGLLLGTPLFIDPAQPLLQGIAAITNPAIPASFGFPLPATSASAGLRVYLQAVQIWPGAIYGSNLQSLVLTW